MMKNMMSKMMLQMMGGKTSMMDMMGFIMSGALKKFGKCSLMVNYISSTPILPGSDPWARDFEFLTGKTVFSVKH